MKDIWSGWPVERILYLFLAIVFLAVFVQVTLFHSRQNFRHWAMWLPVIITPTLGILSFLLVVQNVGFLRWLMAATASTGALTGLVGSYFHFVGVGERVDGYTYNNFMVGPPPMLPLLVTSLSALALILLYLV